MSVNKSLAYKKTYSFAIKIIGVFRGLQDNGEYILSKQLLRCGTSVGANIAEANGAISNSDFSAKISIAYKEILETKYWLSLLMDTAYLDKSTYDNLHSEADEIAKIRFSILKTTRINKQQL
jgi:four helix bundle protein